MKNEYTLHLDFDYPLPQSWIKVWKEERIAMLNRMGFTVDRVIIKDPKDAPELAETVYKGRKGKHGWIQLTSPRKLTDEEVCMLEFLCGDDHTRNWINRLRVERGLKKFWSKLFTRHVWKRPLDKICERCKIRKIIYEMRKEMEK